MKCGVTGLECQKCAPTCENRKELIPEKPILFNTEMVQAILEGRKTSTRRVVKYDFKTVYTTACANGKWCETYGKNLPNNLIEWYVKEKAKPPYQAGDILYVRETWSTQYDGMHDDNGYGIYVYKADGTVLDNSEMISSSKWHPSIHMPKAAARIFLKVTDVKVQGLQDITEEDALKEGVTEKIGYDSYTGEFLDRGELNSYINGFHKLWDSCGYMWPKCWSYNPWVWAIEFERSQA